MSLVLMLQKLMKVHHVVTDLWNGPRIQSKSEADTNGTGGQRTGERAADLFSLVYS